jgi:uncharacterized protein (TIGR03067 family)
MAVRVVLIVVSVLVLGFAPAPLPRREKPREDLTDVAGTWQIVRWESYGARDRDVERIYQVRLTRESFSLVAPREERQPDFVMRLNPAVWPPAFTLTRGKLVRFSGSYRLHKDELTMIFDGGDREIERPTDFEGRTEYRCVLRRVRR